MTNKNAFPHDVAATTTTSEGNYAVELVCRRARDYQGHLRSEASAFHDEADTHGHGDEAARFNKDVDSPCSVRAMARLLETIADEFYDEVCGE